MSLCRPSGNTFDADRKLYRRTFSDRSIPDKRIPPRTLPIVEVSSAAFLYIGQQFLTVFVKVMSYEMEHSFLRNDLD